MAFGCSQIPLQGIARQTSAQQRSKCGDMPGKLPGESPGHHGAQLRVNQLGGVDCCKLSPGWTKEAAVDHQRLGTLLLDLRAAQRSGKRPC